MLARTYILCMFCLGLSGILNTPVEWPQNQTAQFLVYLGVSALASTLKVRLPGIKGTMSVSYVFVLLAIVTFSLFQTLLLAMVSGLIQTFWKPKSRPKLAHSAFNLASLLVSANVSFRVYEFCGSVQFLKPYPVVVLALTAFAYFLLNTISIAIVVSLTERKTLFSIYSQCYFWYFPYYLLGAWAAGLVEKANATFGWPVSLLTIPVLVAIYRSYRLYLNHLETQKNHAEEMARLHLRTIEALALAIEAKDETTHKHLERVQHYALEVGKVMNLDAQELDALRAAAVLHDIGKLAVPEHIISKPGKLTPEEFEKMKIHPRVGAEILERVKFPYPVAPIVRAHHEKWDGTGYPEGLKGTEIPIGARILAAVDCLDALASDRQYRKALPLDEAMRIVAERAGTSFDPAVVAVLQERYVELERAVSEATKHCQPIERGAVRRGFAPASGFENTAGKPGGPVPDFLTSIAAARQEVQTLLEVSQDLGSSLSLTETISVLDQRLRRLIPFQTLVIFLRDGNHLAPEYVNGENFHLFSSLRIPLGEGLSGWVAANNKPIVNGNPSVEFGYLNDPSVFSTLRSALAMPLVSMDRVQGVIALYQRDADAFSKDHLRILMAISAKITLVVENAVRYRQAEMSATTDGLTGLPNSSSMFLHLDGELARAKRSGSPLTILVCDLDGFKQVNDALGHLEGNRVLREVAVALKAACREYDFVARMGGDEFVMVLPGMHPDELQRKIAGLSAAVRRIGEDCGRHLAVSIGEASYPRHGEDAEELLSAADHNMYRAKKERKDRRRALETVAAKSDSSLDRLALACSTLQ
jgi:diguanylate cyclase (GGDEF)-like protein/putative nucleotidyltransferase with HDIG domain